jgi:hypothetical protein
VQNVVRDCPAGSFRGSYRLTTESASRYCFTCPPGVTTNGTRATQPSDCNGELCYSRCVVLTHMQAAMHLDGGSLCACVACDCCGHTASHSSAALSSNIKKTFRLTHLLLLLPVVSLCLSISCRSAVVGAGVLLNTTDLSSAQALAGAGDSTLSDQTVNLCPYGTYWEGGVLTTGQTCKPW